MSEDIEWKNELPSDLDAGLRARAEVFGRLFEDFEPDRVRRLIRETYSEDVVFDDTLKRIEGLAELEPYLVASAGHVEACRVRLLDATRSGDDHYLRWEMLIRFKKFRKGVDTVSQGMSQLRFDAENRITFHRDFWDSTGGFFEHLPLLGRVIRWIKSRV